MKKISLTLAVIVLCFISSISAQQPVEKTKKASQKLNEKTAKVAADAQEITNNVNGAVDNVKSILKVFEPFFVQAKGSANVEVTVGDNTSSPNNGQAAPTSDGTVAPSTTDNPTSVPNQPTDNTDATNASTNTPTAPSSTTYNNDGTAYWGCQDHLKYGCYLDAQQGFIFDDVDVATQTGAVDVIFTSYKNGGHISYALVSPNYAKTSTRSRLLFNGEKYKGDKYPAKQWVDVNASEIGLSSITGVQFEKIKDSKQLIAVVNQVANFKESYESAAKLDGKVFAIRTQLENRTTYALIYVVTQYGSIGSSSYMKVKLKVSGTDANGDGLPDTN
jgi:hypothetical protein